MLKQEGAYRIISEKFYRVVVQVVLLFGSETWVLSAAILNKLEGVNVDFLRQVTGIKAQRLGDETWTKEGPDRVHQAAGTKPLQEYINKRQATIAEWVGLHTIFEVSAGDIGYEGGGELCKPWWQQEAAEQQVDAMLRNILEAAGERRRQESDRRGRGKGGE